MTTRVIPVHDCCTADGCGKKLRLLLEAERGTCAACHLQAISGEARAALSRLLDAAYVVGYQRKQQLIDAALKTLSDGLETRCCQ